MNSQTKEQKYIENVLEDIEELKKYYPLTSYTILPTTKLQPIRIRTIAVSRKLIQLTRAEEQDFLGMYSKELEVVVPFDYKKTGCQVYGGEWIDTAKIPNKDRHFYNRNVNGKYLFCVGVPESFPKMKNVILENIRTADRMLVAYELFQNGYTNQLELLAYSHGDDGRNEYKRETEKYKTKQTDRSNHECDRRK